MYIYVCYITTPVESDCENGCQVEDRELRIAFQCEGDAVAWVNRFNATHSWEEASYDEVMLVNA